MLVESDGRGGSGARRDAGKRSVDRLSWVAWADLEPTPPRGPVALDGYGATLVGTSELLIDLPSCNGDPVLDALEEDDEEVRIRVVTTLVVSDVDAACADVVEVPLDRPLDDRTVIDLVSGAAIDIVSSREPDVELDCFDADYPLEPTFATPEAALADAVANQSQEVEPPDDLADYRRVDHGQSVVDFEFRLSDDDFHTWGIIRDDGRWGLWSRSPIGQGPLLRCDDERR